MKNTESQRRRLDHDREFLRRLGSRKLKGGERDMVDLSGLVQKTLMEAHQAGDKFPGGGEAEREAWLARAFTNNLTDEIRRLRTASRDVSRERPIDETADGSSDRGRGELAANHSTPSERVCRNEEDNRLRVAVSALPENQRRVIELHYLQCRPVSEVATMLGRSTASVAGLLFRGMEALKATLDATKLEGKR